MKYIDDIIHEAIETVLGKEILFEYGMKPNRLKDKFGEVLDAIVDNLVCICLYPNNPAVQHWRERACGLCKRFVDLDIDPINKNKFDFRLKYLKSAVAEVLNKDFSAIQNHFKTVSAYYANKKNHNERIISVQPYNICYQQNAERVKNGVMTLIKFIAEQNYEGLIKFMETF